MPIGTKPKNRGETIMETVIAMAILAVGISMASTIMGASLRNMNASKNRVIAVNVAREGLEAIRNIRDTNWLQFSSKKRECWNHNPGADIEDDCDGSRPIPPGEYIVFKEALYGDPDPSKVTGWKWRLQDVRQNRLTSIPPVPPMGSPPLAVYYNESTQDESKKNRGFITNGAEWKELALLYVVDVDSEVDTDGDHNYTNDPDAYNHALVQENNALGKDSAVPTVFRRTLTIEYLANDGAPKTNGSTANELKDYNRMRIRSKVVWREAKFEFTTDLETNLTDYLGRESLSN